MSRRQPETVTVMISLTIINVDAHNWNRCVQLNKHAGYSLLHAHVQFRQMVKFAQTCNNCLVSLHMHVQSLYIMLHLDHCMLYIHPIWHTSNQSCTVYTRLPDVSNTQSDSLRYA